MNIEVFTGVAPDFKQIHTVDFCCPHCSRRILLPVEMILPRVADRVEEYYRKQNEHLVNENKRLRDIIEFGELVQTIKDVAKRL